jgi:hypothetical protein
MHITHGYILDLQDITLDWTITLKFVLRKIVRGCELDLYGSLWDQVVIYCEHGNEPLRFHKKGVS